MAKRSLSVLLLWNVLITGVLIWLVVGRSRTTATASTAMTTGGSDTLAAPVAVPRDTAGLKSGRIAFFFMDTLKDRYELVKETADRVLKAGRSWDGDLKSRGMSIAQKMQALEEKDQTYTTMAEKEQDSKAYADLQRQMQQLQAEQDSKQRQLDEMQMKALQEITTEIQGYLEEYNRTAGFDYIFSIQEGGQIWVGNKGLDITADIVAGLNQRHQTRKAGTPVKK